MSSARSGFPSEKRLISQPGTAELAHAIYYPPRNPRYVAPEAELPPLIVTSHGGPTANASRVLDLRAQFWTTRGFGVVDVDYRGSTGYGRSYRGALEGRWGLADVEDCAAAAQWLADGGRVSPDRMVIRGGSSSGLTAMAALARHKTFVAAVVLFGVADLTSLTTTTHKFESRYVGRLVPEAELVARSPLQLVGSINVPVMFVHGLDDKVVPPDQSRRMVSALRQNGVRSACRDRGGEPRLPEGHLLGALARGRARVLRLHLRFQPGRRPVARQSRPRRRRDAGRGDLAFRASRVVARPTSERPGICLANALDFFCRGGRTGGCRWPGTSAAPAAWLLWAVTGRC